MSPAVVMIDSGVGGLTVWRALRRQWPQVGGLYVADSLHCPYGGRSTEDLLRITLPLLRRSMGMGLSLEAEGGVDAVIAACNTTSALVLDRWQEACEGVPVLGMIEPTLQAIVDSGARSVGIIGTEATVASGVHRAGLARLDPAMRVWSMACPGWVEAVETGQWDSPSLERSMQDVGARVAAEGSELLVYGCTHFPWLDAMVAQYLPSSVVRLDPAEAVAKALVALLGCGSGGKLGESEHSGVWHFYATSAPEVAMLRARSLIGLDCPFGWLETADTVDS